MKKINAAITGVQGYLPPKVVTNHDLAKFVDTSDEWITSRTGIKERRLMENGATSDMAAEAVKGLLKKTNTKPEDIEVVIVGTVTPDYPFPSTANVLCDKAGLSNAWSFDVNAACSGFIYALATGTQFIESGRYKKIIVVGADKMSSIIDYEDRTTCIIFGDGCGAVMLEPTQEEIGIIDSILHIDGSGHKYLTVPAGGSANPASKETLDNKMHYVYQDGKTVYKFAVKNMANVSKTILDNNKLQGSDVKLFIPHQANRRIIDAAAKRCGLKDDQVLVNINKYGNTTAGTIPIALDEAVETGRLNKNDLLLLAAFGGGFTWGSMLIRWGELK